MSSVNGRAPDTGLDQRTPVQKAALAMAMVLVILGVLGFVPGITANYGDLAVTGIGADAMLFGLLPVSITHSMLLLLFAAALVLASRRSAGAAKVVLLGLTLFNFACAAYGLINVRYESTLWEPAGAGDNWFHLVLGLVLFGLGLVRGPKSLGRRKT